MRAVLVLLLVVVYLCIGVAFYKSTEEKPCDDSSGCVESWTMVDALYFSTVTMSTVGYGDLTPSTKESKTFTMLYIFVGITVVFSQVANACAGCLADVEHMFLKCMDIFDYTGHVSGQQRGISGKKVDLSGDGYADFVMPPNSIVFWLQRLLPWVIMSVIAQLASAAVFCAVQPDLEYFDAFYHSFVTATTVGYGDISLTTQDARLFAIFHIIFSVTFFAALVGRVQELMDLRRAEVKRANLLMNQADEEWLSSICRQMDTDGLGVDKLEFVVGMLTKMGVELCGQTLEWSDVKPLLALFDSADKTQDGRLNEEDLRKMAQERSTRRAQRAGSPRAPVGAKVAPDVQYAADELT